MKTLRTTTALAVALCVSASAWGASRSWDEGVGEVAPPLIASEWVGTPVSLEAVKGNAVVLAFWNADIPC